MFQLHTKCYKKAWKKALITPCMAKRFVCRADKILLSIHRLDDESKMLMSWQLRSSREREFHLFQSIVIVKLRLHFTNCVPDMWNKESVSEHSDRSIRQRFLCDACHERRGKHVIYIDNSGKTLHTILLFLQFQPCYSYRFLSCCFFACIG